MLLAACIGRAQPFIDVVYLSSQLFSSNYSDSTKAANTTYNHTANIFLPKEFRNGNAFLFRFNAEQLHSGRYSSTGSSAYDLYALSAPVGFQFSDSARKWKLLLMAIPKISSDFKGTHRNDLQLGGISLITYVHSPRLKAKLGLYYNREFFGNFFIPLAGIDWKASDRLSFYGLLPTNYRMEVKLSKVFYTGIGFKTYQRSYRLGTGQFNDFVWVHEIGVKAFLDIYLTRQLVLFGDIGYMLQYKLVQYQHGNVRAERGTNPLYTTFGNNLFFTAGLAFRIRRD